MNRLSVLLVLAALGTFTGCGGQEKKETMKTQSSDEASPADVFITKVIDSLDHTESILGEISKAAEAAADCAFKGGKIYITDDETVTRTGREETKMIPGGGMEYPMHEDWGGFVAEACDRAGGLRHIQPVPLNNQVQEHDIVLLGTVELRPEEQAAQIKMIRERGALVIVFGSKASTIAGLGDFFIDNGLGAGTMPVMTIGSKTTGPVAPIANVVNMWTFTAEYVAALTRAGKMPALWQSMFMPGAAPRNKKIGDFLYHPDLKIAPVQSGVLGMQYISTVRGYLSKIKANELSQFDRAGKLCADTIKSGNKVVANIIGHFMVAQLRMPGYPDLFTVKANLYGRDYLVGVLGKGDTWLHVGYSYTPVQELSYAREVGAKTICVLTPGPTEVGEGTPVAPDMSAIDIYIDPYWKHGDAVVEVSGYDMKIIPPSGVVMITAYWMIIGETMKNL